MLSVLLLLICIFNFMLGCLSSYLVNIFDFEGLFEINMNELKIYLNICDKLIYVVILNW